MKFSPNILVLLPVIAQQQFPLFQLINFHNSPNTDFWSYCLFSLVSATAWFFFIETMWSFFRRKITKLGSAYPFWRQFLTRILSNVETVQVALGWIVINSLIFASVSWGNDILTEKSVTHFGFYITLSLLLNFYLAALFCF